MIRAPELRNYGSLADVGLGLLFLKYGRDHEREADSLGLRYITRAGYDPRPMPDVFTTLERVGNAEDGPADASRAGWPPTPRRRTGARASRRRSRSWAPAAGTVDREEYIRRLDGIVFGENPREGFFQQNVFYHPGPALPLRVPARTGRRATPSRPWAP